MIEIKIDYSHIMETLKKLPEAMQKEMLGKAVSAGATLVKKAALTRVPLGKTGNLRKSLVTKRVSSASPFVAMYMVKFAQGGQYKGYHAQLVEKGHYIFKRKKRGRGAAILTGKRYEMVNTGKKTTPHPMLRPAFFNNQKKILDTVARYLSADKIERNVLRKIRTREKVVRGR